MAFERFTDRARKTMALANKAAQRWNHEFIGPEHVLLGLVEEGAGVGAHALAKLGVNLWDVRAEVEKLVQSGPDAITFGKLPQTPQAKKVIEYAIEEARNLNHNYVGTEHMLLGLIREEGIAAQVLLRHGVTLDAAQTAIVELLAQVPADTSPGIASFPPAAECLPESFPRRVIRGLRSFWQIASGRG